MAEAVDRINPCEALLNKIATELVLTAPGKDDGLVPVYALVSELFDLTQDHLQQLWTACGYLKTTIGILLDNGQPFDEDNLNYLDSFSNWAQEHLIAVQSGKQTPDFPAPDWLDFGDSEEDLDTTAESEIQNAGNGEVDDAECQDVLNKIATELLLAAPGTDDSLVPIYSLINDFEDLTAGNDALVKSTENVKHSLDDLLDNAKSWDSHTLHYMSEFTVWAQEALKAVRDNNLKSLKVFETLTRATPTKATAKSGLAPAYNNTDADEKERLLVAKDTDVMLELENEEDREILSEFHSEAVEHLDHIEAALLVLENDPCNEESLASMFRSFHTIKGVSGFLHLVPIQALAHEIEFLLDKARNKKLTLNSAMISLILKSQDTIQALINQITLALQKGQLPDKVIPVSHLIVSARKAQKSDDAHPFVFISEGEPQEESIEDSADTTNEATSEHLFPPSSSLDSAIESNELINEDHETTPAKSAVQATRTAEKSTIRVSTLKLDNLMDMVGELVIVQSQLAESSKQTDEGDNSLFYRNLAQLHRITRELQHTSMSLRLVPIKPTFQKVGRLVRDLSRTCNKRVNFIVEGEDTELDRNVVEQISDPLIHMIRNSIDHGLEPADERARVGKPEAGKIELKAYHLGSNIIIELTDDGKGIDPQKVLQKARQRGLIAENSEPTTAEILNMIFEPGFSTAEKVTDVSGRGVGMDVVRRNIEQLRGKVELESKVGKGTIFKIKLPLTTAIIDGLVVRVGTEKFILPTTSVQVALKANPKQMSKIKGRMEVLDLRGKTIPIVRLHQLFNIETEILNPCDGIIVIIETFGRPFGLLVDEMLSKQEVVIKTLGGLMNNISGVAGGAILGDGSIALILDPSSLSGRS
jgi:two-component system chemotaxis sensor kinase CheA